MSTQEARPAITPEEGLSRRSLLSRSATGVGIALTGSVNGLFGADAAAAHGRAHKIGYGPLVPDPAGVLALPHGFSYKVVAQAGVTTLESGEPTPSDADGTASFVRRGGNGSVLVMNHEIGGGEPYSVPHLSGLVYDPQANGGTTTLVPQAAVSPPQRARPDSNLRLLPPEGATQIRLTG